MKLTLLSYPITYIEEVERLFGEPLIAYMECKNYCIEANFIRVICNWCHAVDERGISEDQRQQYNKELIDFFARSPDALA